MKKMLTVLSFVIVLFLGGCTSNAEPILKGGYQSEREGIGHVLLMSFQKDNSSFVEYIDNREVDRGTYEKIKNSTYRIKSDKQDFQIKLNHENSFEIAVKKLNNGNLIKLKNVSDTPIGFSTKFSDIDEYKALLD